MPEVTFYIGFQPHLHKTSDISYFWLDFIMHSRVTEKDMFSHFLPF